MNSAQEVEAAVSRVSQLLHRQVGLRPELALRGRLSRCIRDDAQGRGQDLDSYVDSLLVDGEALQRLLNMVTVQESAYFRHPEQFEMLAREILPTLGPSVTIWSAGCANGQEAFSLAMLLDEHHIDGRVIGTDLSTEALGRTNAARYSTREISGVSPERIARHLTRDGKAWLVNSNIRGRVSTFQHNLLGPVPNQVRTCQVIFCRNVLIYFSPEHARTFLDQVAEVLPAARLFLGAAETIWQLSDRYETVRSGDTFSYRCRADSTSAGNQGSRAVARSLDPSPRTPDPSPRTLDLSPRTLDPSPRTRSPGWRVPTPMRTAIPPKGTVPSRIESTGTSPRPAAVPPRPSSAPASSGPAGDAASAVLLAGAGQQASAAGDVQAAVIAFRKCVYLTPHDPMAHLHLGLALESAGDQPSAQRAYAAARRALTPIDPTHIYDATEGYTTADIIRLLDSKLQVVNP